MEVIREEPPRALDIVAACDRLIGFLESQFIILNLNDLQFAYPRVISGVGRRHS